MTTLTIYPNPADFLAQTQTTLECDEAANGLLLGIALRLKQHPERVSADFFLATVHEGAQLAATAIMTPPHTLVVQCDLADPSPAFTALAQRLLDWPQQPSGVNGRMQLSQQFAEIWRQLSGQNYRAAVQLRLFRLDKVVYGLGQPNSMRPAEMRELMLVMQWLDEFEQEALPHAPHKSDPAAVEWRIRQGDIFLWEDAGKVVSLAGRSRPTAHGISIGPVYTPPALRGHGYATALVAQLSQHLLDSGYQFTCLFTDLANPTSNSIYQKIGYRPVCDFTEYLFESIL